MSSLNQVWLADITYIRIRTGFVYLSAVLDAFSRRVIGYAISSKLDASLTLEALRMAVTERQPDPGVIHHSDKGVQYASAEYTEELKAQLTFRSACPAEGIPMTMPPWRASSRH